MYHETLVMTYNIMSSLSNSTNKTVLRTVTLINILYVTPLSSGTYCDNDL